MTLPEVARADLFIYERAAVHHHSEGADSEAKFGLRFFVLPEQLGVRLRITDGVPGGTLVADVAVVYEWARPATPADEIDEFVIRVGIPQVLSCASTVLMDTAKLVDSTVPFYGYEAVDRLVNQFIKRPTKLTTELAVHLAKEVATENDVN